MHWSEAVRMNFTYIIKNENGKMLTTAYTVQLLTDLNMEILLVRPDFIVNFIAAVAIIPYSCFI